MSRLPPFVTALLDPAAYPHPVSRVELVETHISYIFLTGAYAYKVKKPVDYGFVDFSTLERRRYFCHREVSLNRRISPAIYLGVSEVRKDGDLYTMDGPGETVEYAVEMRQMPRELLMARLLKQGKVTQEHILCLAAAIARFHEGAERGAKIARLGGFETVRQNITENFAGAERHVGICLSQDAFEDIEAYSFGFLDSNEELFRTRAQEGRIRDCHGDLHTAQIYLEDEGCSFLDCIEFNDRLRYSDVAADIAFLAMDLDFHGRPDLSRLFVQAYVQESGDRGVLKLLDFFKSYRAYVRGKVTSLRLDAPDLSAETRNGVLGTAGAYFNLARSYARLPAPMLVLAAGLSGTGKSAIAQELARRWGLDYVSSDVTRKELAGVAPTERRHEPFGQGIYSPDFSRRTYAAMLGRASRSLTAGRSVVLDATFRRAEDRARAVSLARELGAHAWVIECVLPLEQVRRRLEERSRRGGSASDARWEIIAEQQGEWEPVREMPPERHIVLDASGTPQGNVRRLLKELYTRGLGRRCSRGTPSA